jgi:hypothetical protein
MRGGGDDACGWETYREREFDGGDDDRLFVM